MGGDMNETGWGWKWHLPGPVGVGLISAPVQPSTVKVALYRLVVIEFANL